LNQPLKLLFDECLGKPLLKDIAALLSWENPPPTIHHLLDYFSSRTHDDIWIPKVVDGGWVIITSDQGKQSNRAKLPQICLEYKITHILMSSSLLHRKQNQKANAIVAAWEEIKKCADAPKVQGSCCN
jgi:hypothetical protein